MDGVRVRDGGYVDKQVTSFQTCKFYILMFSTRGGGPSEGDGCSEVDTIHVKYLTTKFVSSKITVTCMHFYNSAYHPSKTM